MLGTWRVVSLVGRGNGWKRFLRKEKELWGSYGGKGGRVRYLSVVGRGNDGGVGLLDSSCLLHKVFDFFLFMLIVVDLVLFLQRESTLREGTNLLANKRGIVGEFCSRYSTKTVEKEVKKKKRKKEKEKEKKEKKKKKKKKEKKKKRKKKEKRKEKKKRTLLCFFLFCFFVLIFFSPFLRHLLEKKKRLFWLLKVSTTQNTNNIRKERRKEPTKREEKNKKKKKEREKRDEE